MATNRYPSDKKSFVRKYTHTWVAVDHAKHTYEHSHDIAALYSFQYNILSLVIMDGEDPDEANTTTRGRVLAKKLQRCGAHSTSAMAAVAATSALEFPHFRLSPVADSWFDSHRDDYPG